jgi:hypothetical protein
LSKAPAFIGKAGPVARIVHIRQPQHDRPKSALTLHRAVARNAVAGRRAGFDAISHMPIVKRYA